MKSWVKIWTEIADAFDTPRSKRNERQADIAWSGLCVATREVGKDYNIPQKLSPNKHGWWWPVTKTKDPRRAFFAGFMAAMGNKGFEDFLEWCKEHK